MESITEKAKLMTDEDGISGIIAERRIMAKDKATEESFNTAIDGIMKNAPRLDHPGRKQTGLKSMEKHREELEGKAHQCPQCGYQDNPFPQQSGMPQPDREKQPGGPSESAGMLNPAMTQQQPQQPQVDTMSLTQLVEQLDEQGLQVLMEILKKKTAARKNPVDQGGVVDPNQRF